MSWIWPWQQRDPETGIATAQYEDPAGPLQANGLFFSVTDQSNNEFSPIEVVTQQISKATVAASRILTKDAQVPTPQQTERKWYDITGKVSDAASSANNALQSTLVKVIVLVVIVGLIGIFGVSYAQTKGVQFAK